MPMKLFGGFRRVDRGGVARDVLAGVSAAAINIPQVLGYARIAGAPVVAGLYTVLLPLLGFAAFGSSRHLVVAADSATAAILSGSLTAMAPAGSAHYMELVSTVALLTAGILLVARIFKLGFLADFLSRTVLVGFLTGVGLQVGVAMAADMCGISVDSRNSWVRAWEVVRSLGNLHAATVALSAVVTVVLLLGNRFARRIPLGLAVVVGSIALSAAFDFARHGIATLGPLPGGLPTLGLPSVTWTEALALLPVSASCFIMIIAQSAATSRGFAVRYREEVDSNADILGLAAANAAAGLSGTIVVNGSPTQTAMAERMGARSQITQVALASVVLLVLLLLTAPLKYLPRCVLASVVFTIAMGMIDIANLRAIRRESPGEFTLAIVTTATVVSLGVEQGILLAIALSLFRHVSHSYRPHTMMLLPGNAGPWEPAPVSAGKETAPGLIVYRFGADLFYANVNYFAQQLRALVERAPRPLEWLVLDCGAITDIDYSAAGSLRDLLNDLAAEKVQVVFGRVSTYLRADLDRHWITPVIGSTRIFGTLHEAIRLAQGGKPPLTHNQEPV